METVEDKWLEELKKWWPYSRTPSEEDLQIFNAAFSAAEKEWGKVNASSAIACTIKEMKPDPETAVVVVKVQGYDALTMDEINGFDSALKAKLKNSELVTVFLGPDESVEELNDLEMEKRGWMRSING